MKELKMSIKDLVWIITLVISIAGTYYTLNSKNKILELKVEQLELKLEKTNIEIIKNDLDYVKKDIGEIKTDLKEHFTIVNSILLDD